MKRALALYGSPREKGNSTILLKSFSQGLKEGGVIADEVVVEKTNIGECQGCLRCNILGRCRLTNDQWPELADKILSADIIAWAAPVYFHHLPSSVKRIVDRFRSFVQVQIGQCNLLHRPWHIWHKKFVIILSQGSPDKEDSQPIIDLFSFICHILGKDNHLVVIIGSRLAVENQVQMTREQLSKIYQKLKIPVELADDDFLRNQELLRRCFSLGVEMALK